MSLLVFRPTREFSSSWKYPVYTEEQVEQLLTEHWEDYTATAEALILHADYFLAFDEISHVYDGRALLGDRSHRWDRSTPTDRLADQYFSKEEWQVICRTHQYYRWEYVELRNMPHRDLNVIKIVYDTTPDRSYFYYIDPKQNLSAEDEKSISSSYQPLAFMPAGWYTKR